MDKKLYIKPCYDVPIDSVLTLIKSLYANIGDFNHSRPYARHTYYNEECTMLECRAERRSFDDLFTLSKTYFPDTTEKDLMAVLIELKLKFYYCNDIFKLVFHYMGTEYIEASGFEGNINKYYTKDTYTAEDLLNIYNQL